MTELPFFHTNVSDEATRRVTDVMRSGFISAGKMAEEFERALTVTLGCVNPVTVNSATSALHLALVAAGVAPGHEVIIPAQTFIATGLVVLMQGATVVFADIDPDTGNIDPDSV